MRLKTTSVCAALLCLFAARVVHAQQSPSSTATSSPG